MFAISDMMRVSLAQYALVALVTVVCATVGGGDAALSALIAGLAYVVPSSLLVLCLVLPRRVKSVKPRATAVLVGEFVKIFFVVALLGLAVKYYEQLNWPAVIFTIVAVANSYFIVLFKKN